MKVSATERRSRCEARATLNIQKGVGKHGGILSVSGRLHQAVELEETDALDNGSGEILTQVIVTRSVLSAPRRGIYRACARTAALCGSQGMPLITISKATTTTVL